MLETFGSVVNEVLNYGFADGPQVNKARIETWVNEGQFQIAREVEANEFQETAEISLKQGQYKYGLPEDFLRVQDIYYPELVARLRPLDIQQFDQTSPTKFEGPPEMYTLYKEELWLFPTPNATGEKLELRYIKNATPMVSENDLPILDKNYLHLLVYYALVRAFEAEDDQEQAQAYKNRYKEILDNYATDKQWRVVDRPRYLDGSWTGSGYGGRVI